jgi:hypothetical protein
MSALPAVAWPLLRKALVTGVVALALLGGFSFGIGRSSAGPVSDGQVRLTGFAASGMVGAGIHPVSITTGGAAASRLDQLVTALAATPMRYCRENGLLYRIAFTDSAEPQRGFTAVGYDCGGIVLVTMDGKSLIRRGDCALLRAVALVLPARAAATKRDAAQCWPVAFSPPQR